MLRINVERVNMIFMFTRVGVIIFLYMDVQNGLSFEYARSVLMLIKSIFK